MGRMTNAELQDMDEARVRLCDQMTLIRNGYNALSRPYASNDWGRLAHLLSELEHFVRSAGFVVNEIQRPAKKSL
jgi:hypothetical protein